MPRNSWRVRNEDNDRNLTRLSSHVRVWPARLQVNRISSAILSNWSRISFTYLKQRSVVFQPCFRTPVWIDQMLFCVLHLKKLRITNTINNNNSNIMTKHYYIAPFFPRTTSTVGVQLCSVPKCIFHTCRKMGFVNCLFCFCSNVLEYYCMVILIRNVTCVPMICRWHGHWLGDPSCLV